MKGECFVMTRGRMIVITENNKGEIYKHVGMEFNGDMMPSCLGRVAYNYLRQVNSISLFKEVGERFKAKYFPHYNFPYDVVKRKVTTQMTGKNLIPYAFKSDYVYLKNLTKQTVTIKAKNYAEPIAVRPNQIVVFFFDRYVSDDELLKAGIKTIV